MGPGAYSHRIFNGGARNRRGIVWPSVIAILFATFAAISFAVDQSVDLSTFPTLMLEE